MHLDTVVDPPPGRWLGSGSTDLADDLRTIKPGVVGLVLIRPTQPAEWRGVVPGQSSLRERVGQTLGVATVTDAVGVPDDAPLRLAEVRSRGWAEGKTLAPMLFVGDDWDEDHHHVEIVDEAEKVLARKRFSEGLEAVTRLPTLIAEHAPAGGESGDRDRARPFVAPLVAAGYPVFAVKPMSVARYRERHSTSGGQVRHRRR